MTFEEKREIQKNVELHVEFFFCTSRKKRGEAGRVLCVKMIYLIRCREKDKRYSSSSSKEQQQQQQRFLYSYAKKSASRQLLLKRATDARRRKFSNDDDVERARE